ncbi:terminase small subunit [Methylomonas sp. AM2-LC]|uniref:terminase small subunit n=1 Tax=Methylomonas sp. AM2-LC TaxID=3153301 RepID=UPI0032661041
MSAYDLLNDKQKRFVDEYLIDLHPEGAALRAGYSNKSARQIGNENLSKPTIKMAVLEKQRERAVRVAASQDRVILELGAIAYSDPREAFDAHGALRPVNEWSDSLSAAIKSVKVSEQKDAYGMVVGLTKELAFWDKNKALEMLAKHLGMFDADSDSMAVQTADALKSALKQARPKLQVVK